jgi:hypothetical protein
MKLFPTLCQKISGRFEEYRGNQKKENAKNLRSEIRNTAIFLHESSTYPSIHWMGKTLKKPGIMRSPVAISAYYEILEELGYKGEPKNRPNNGGVSGEMT